LKEAREILIIVYLTLKTTFCAIRHKAKPSLKEGMQDWLDTV
jgi:hypothetical protein